MDSIPPGSDFIEYLDERISQCGVLLALIGNRWLKMKNEDGGNRLFDKDDFVRGEIASALDHGIIVIPVLVENAKMPRKEELPPKLKQLSTIQAETVRPGLDFEHHTERLIKGLGKMGIKPLPREEAMETIEPSRQNQGLPKAKTAKSKSWWSWLPWFKAKTVACPNCFCPFDTSTLQFRCTNLDCPSENDPEHAHFLGIPASTMRKVIRQPTKGEIEGGKAVCRVCEETTIHLICPLCHAEIPHNSWQNKDFICSLMGSVGSGKSIFIHVFLNHLYKGPARLMGPKTSFNFSTERGWEKFASDKRFVEEGRGLQTTLTYIQNQDVRIPFIGTLKTWRYKKGGYSSKETLKSNLIMYDNAGEDFKVRAGGPYFKRILHSNALVFIVDPLSFPGYAKSIGRGLISDQTPLDVIRNIYNNYCREHPDMNLGDKVKVPLAVVLNKLDLTQPYFPPDSKIFRPAFHGAGVDMENLKQASEEARIVIDELGGAALNESISERFENYMYFGVTNGRDDAAGRFDARQFRILDPMIWLMHQHDLISAAPPAPNGEG